MSRIDGLSVCSALFLFQLSERVCKSRKIVKRNVIILRKSDSVMQGKFPFTTLPTAILFLRCTEYNCNFALAFVGIFSQISDSLVKIHKKITSYKIKILVIKEIIPYNQTVILTL